MVPQDLQLLPNLGSHISIPWMQTGKAKFERIDFLEPESLLRKRSDACEYVRQPSARLGSRLLKERERAPPLTDILRTDLDSVPYRVDPCIVREGGEE